MKKKYQSIETKAVHSGQLQPRIQGAVSLPVFQSSTYEFRGEDNYHDLRYIRLNNTPNHQVLHDKLADLEGGKAALVTSSGMAAISTTLLTLLKQGDHLLAQRGLYGGSHHFIVEDLPAWGIGYDLIRGDHPETWKSQLRPNTRLIYVEAISNPLMEVADLRAVVAFAQDHGLLTLIDNTFATPVNFRPLEIGFDISLHSGTKYLNGHSDIVAGAIIARSRELLTPVLHKLNHLGGSLDPHACFLLERGIKTLALRVEQQNRSALRLAEFFQDHPAVARVNYPGLTSHPDFETARDLFSGFGGMLSFELDASVKATDRMLDQLDLPIVAPSLGGVETLVTRPATTSHSGMPRAERESLGIRDELVRVSVGIEAAEDLIADFKRALETIGVGAAG